MRMLMKYIHDELLTTPMARLTLLLGRTVFALAVIMALWYLYTRDCQAPQCGDTPPVDTPPPSELTPTPPDWFKETIRQYKQGEL